MDFFCGFRGLGEGAGGLTKLIDGLYSYGSVCE